MKISIAAALDPGKERERNEDALAVCNDLLNSSWSESLVCDGMEVPDYGTLAVVADGMGGENAGDLASQTAISAVKGVFTNDAVNQALSVEGGIESLMRHAVNEADRLVLSEAEKAPENIGLGTTIVICWMIWPMVYVAWCGDSRCYVFSHSKGLIQLTKDHSFVQELIDKGELTEEDALTHPEASVITRALGDQDCPSEADFTCHKCSDGDSLLLCSDGLCGYVCDSEIERLMRKNEHKVKATVDSLLGVSLDAGGFDNISIIMMTVKDDGGERSQKKSLLGKLSAFFRKLFR